VVREAFVEILKKIEEEYRGRIELHLWLFREEKRGLERAIERCSTAGVFRRLHKLGIYRGVIEEILGDLVEKGSIEEREREKAALAFHDEEFKIVSESAKEFEERCLAKK